MGRYSHLTIEAREEIMCMRREGRGVGDIARAIGRDKSTLDRWIRRVHACGSTAAADNRTPEQNRLIELERENARLRMEVDVLKQAALIFARR